MQYTSVSKLGDDAVLDTDHLDARGSPETFAVEGRPVTIYGVHAQNENAEDRRIGGQANMPLFGYVSFQH